MLIPAKTLHALNGWIMAVHGMKSLSVDEVRHATGCA